MSLDDLMKILLLLIAGSGLILGIVRYASGRLDKRLSGLEERILVRLDRFENRFNSVEQRVSSVEIEIKGQKTLADFIGALNRIV